MKLSKNACPDCQTGRWVGYNHPECDATVCGKQIQYDTSGIDCNWRNIDASEIPANIREEIECEIIDGQQDECEDFIGSNGLHYRW